jgi:hypothetical protein
MYFPIDKLKEMLQKIRNNDSKDFDELCTEIIYNKSIDRNLRYNIIDIKCYWFQRYAYSRKAERLQKLKKELHNAVLNVKLVIYKFDYIQNLVRILCHFKKNKQMYSPNNLIGKIVKKQLYELVS